MGVASVEQIGSRDQPVSGPPSGINTVFDRLKPAGLVGEQVPRLRGLRLVTAGLAQR